MNVLIQQLADQAKKSVPHGLTPDKWIEVYNEKFAELVVRECVQSIENTIETKCDTDSEKMGCEFAITDLKEHFGVEE